MLRCFSLVVIVVLSACTERGGTDAVRIGRMILDQALGEELETYEPPTRERLNQIRSALLALGIGDRDPVFIVPTAKNGPYLTYLDTGRRGLILQGGAISATVGLGHDLKGLKISKDDPVVYRTPLAEWPSVIKRVYQYRVRDGEDYIIGLTCQFSRGPHAVIEIYELFFETVQVTETCANAYRTVTNTHWVEPDTGFIWRSEQWVSPKLPDLTVEIVRPFNQGR